MVKNPIIEIIENEPSILEELEEALADENEVEWERDD